MDNQLRQGPASFALDASGDGPVAPLAVPQLGAPNANPGQIAPGAAFQGGGVSDADSKTLRAITDLASGVLAPKIKQAAQDQFIQGVQQAMTGQGLDDILKSKPWYTDIFAPSSAAAGARTYTAQMAVAKWAGQMQDMMPELAKQDPDQLQKAATGALQGFMTGDPQADALITSQVVEHMAPLFKQHAKEHYIFLQKQATMAQINAWEAAGKVYQGFAEKAALPPDFGPMADGMVERGNIDLNNRPRVQNPDGSISTVRSLGVNIDGTEVLIPTVVGGKVVSNEEAIQEYLRTGKHLGKFKSADASSKYAQQLHEAQDRQYVDNGSTVNYADLDAAKSRLLGAITPFADQSDDSFSRNISAFLEASATAGNFQVVKLFKDTGLYDKIDPEHRAQLDRSLHVWGRMALNKAIPQFSMDISQLVNDMTQNPRDIPEKVAALNAKAAAITGVSEADMIPPEVVDNLVGRVMVAQRNEADARARMAQSAAEKDAEKVGEIARAVDRIKAGPGAVDACEKVGLCKGDAIEAAGSLAYRAAKTPPDKAAVLNARTSGPFGVVKANFAALMRSPESQRGVEQMAQVYQELAEDVKPHYFSETERATMDRYNSLVLGGTPPDSAWVIAKNAPTLESNMLPATPKDEMSKAIRSVVESSNEYKLMGVNTGFNAVNDATMHIIEAATARAYKVDRGNNTPDVAAKRAYSQALANGLDIQGQFAVIKNNPKDRPLFALIGEGQDATGKAFSDLMQQRAKEQGSSLDHYEAFRVPDRNGKAYFYVRATNSDGREVVWHINSDEVKARVQEGVEQEMTKPAPGTPPPVTNNGGGAAFVYPNVRATSQ